MEPLPQDEEQQVFFAALRSSSWRSLAGQSCDGQEDHEFPIILFRFSSTIRGDARSLVPGTG
jgi:hypothetical protein